MAGSIESEYFGGQSTLDPKVKWELFYRNNNEWIIYGTASGTNGLPKCWYVTITLGTGEAETFTIYPTNIRDVYSKFAGRPYYRCSCFYSLVSFATPSKNTSISVSVASPENETAGVGNFSGNYVFRAPVEATLYAENIEVSATARNDFTWSFDVKVDVVHNIYFDLADAGVNNIATSNGKAVASVSEKNSTRTVGYGDFLNQGDREHHYEFTMESKSTSTVDTQAIKELYASTYPATSLPVSIMPSMLFIWDDGDTRAAVTLYLYETTTTLKIVTPPPTVSEGWFATAVNNSAAGGSDAFQYYIKNISRVRAMFDESKIDISNLCGATIDKYKVALNGVLYSATNTGEGTALNTNVLTKLGDNTLSVSAVDTRGAEYVLGSATVFVYDYAEPTLSNISAYRCDSAGIQDDNGTYLYLRALASVVSVDGHNTATLKARFKPSSGSYGDYSAMENNNALITGGGLVSTSSAYTVEIVATDTAGFSATYVSFIPSEIVLFSLKGGGKAVGVGMHVDAEDDYTYHVAFDTYLHRDLILGNGTRLTEEQLIRLLALIGEV